MHGLFFQRRQQLAGKGAFSGAVNSIDSYNDTILFCQSQNLFTYGGDRFVAHLLLILNARLTSNKRVRNEGDADVKLPESRSVHQLLP